MLATLGTETVNGLRNSPNLTRSCGPLRKGAMPRADLLDQL